MEWPSAAAEAGGPAAPSSSRERGSTQLVDLRGAGFSLRRCALLTILGDLNHGPVTSSALQVVAPGFLWSVGAAADEPSTAPGGRRDDLNAPQPQSESHCKRSLASQLG
eukprot:7354490-Alexandrium_andersonii.AAC.1